MNLKQWWRRRKRKQKQDDSGITKRVYSDSPKYYTQLHAKSEFKKFEANKKELKKIKRRRKKAQRASVFERVSDRVRWVLRSRVTKILAILLVLAAIFVGMQRVTIFSVQEYEIIGANQVSEESILATVEPAYTGKNLLQFSVEEVEELIEANFLFIQEVYVRKELPGTLEIEIIERRPALTLITLDAVHIIDANNVTLVQDTSESLELLPFEQSALLGNASVDDTYVREQYYLDFEEGELPEWDEVPQEEKQSLFERLQNQTFQKVSAYLASQRDTIAEEFRELPEIVLYTNQLFPIDEQVEAEEIVFSSEVLTQLNDSNLGVDRLEWVSQFSVEVILEDGEIIVMSRLREVDEQISEVLLLAEEGALENFTRIDVRVPTIAVE